MCTHSKTAKHHGLGMFLSQRGGKKLFSHIGNNHDYKMHFYCVPETNFIEIYMINHNPMYDKNYIYKHIEPLIR